MGKREGLEGGSLVFSWKCPGEWLSRREREHFLLSKGGLFGIQAPRTHQGKHSPGGF